MERTPLPSARLRDAAVVVPLASLLLLMPPLITLFVGPASVGGVPLVVAWVFGVWLALIVAAAWFARRLVADDEAAAPPAAPPDGSA